MKGEQTKNHNTETRHRQRGTGMVKRLARALALTAVSMTAAAQEAAFPYPAIPAALQTVEERGAYLMEHYWDGFSMTDTTLIHRPEVTEQGFANFIDLLPRVDSIAAERGVRMFTRHVYGADSVPQNMRSHFIKLTEHYLYDPNSPMRSDDIYAMFLRQMLEQQTAFDGAERERMAYRLKNIMKNQPSTQATDFAYIDREGRRRTLYTTEAELLMLYFNDPDCENCHETTATLSRDSLFADNPRLTVLAVYPDADTELWRQKPQPFPKGWTDAYSPNGEITARQLYFIRATPTIYLLDSRKRVLLKDPSPQFLTAWLRERK